MIICKPLKSKSIYVVGLGRTGASAINSLTNSEAIIYAWDDKKDLQNSLIRSHPSVTLCSPSNINWRELNFVVFSPGIPTLEGQEHEVVKYAKDHGVLMISDIDMLYEACPQANYIAITGTNGKSTTTALIGHILKVSGIKCQVGGNIGIAVLGLEPLGSDGFFVLEISSQQLSLIKFAKFNIALLLNISPDHIDYHGDMESYVKAKANIFRKHTEIDKAIISVDCHETKKIAEKIPNSIKISTHHNSHISIQGRILYDNINHVQFDLSDYKYLPGQHNEENIAFAYTACLYAGLASQQIINAIKTFTGLAHRIELVAEINGVKFINDSKATNANSAEKALICFDNIYWILGGISKEGGINTLKPLFHKIKHAFLIGEAEDEFAGVLEQKGVPFNRSHTLENAINDIKLLNLNSGTVLLSPVCASWDQFMDYEHRGQVFKKLIFENFGNL